MTSQHILPGPVVRSVESPEAACQRLLRACFRGEGWRVAVPSAPLPERVSFGLLASRAPGGEPGSRALLYVYRDLAHVRLRDLWRLLADQQLAEADGAVVCLGPDVALTETAARAAGRLGVRVFELFR